MRKKKIVAQTPIEEETKDCLKEFNVKVVDDETKKFWIGFVKAKNKISAISKMMEGNEKKPYSYYII